MKILNIRQGFATNSSSSHSIVINKKMLPTDMCDLYNEGEYGWEMFFLADPEAKRTYIRTVRGEFPSSCYVDHNSVGDVPTDDVFGELVINHPRIAIRGGNDNSEDDRYNFPTIGFGGDVIKREDGPVTVLFNKGNGTKMRYSFDPNVTYERASWPELVDIKITDYCDQGCLYCYQGSTEKGVHADIGAIKTAIDRFSEVGVFEIAIGGGEPTTHPEFLEILKYAKNKGVIPNFTSRKTDWLDRSVFDLIGGMAFSVDTPEEIDTYSDLLLEKFGKVGYGDKKYVDYTIKNKVNMQHVLGSICESDFRDLASKCFDKGYGLTLLGYKTTGRGSSFEPFPVDNWLPIIRELTADRWGVSVGIDTEIAKNYQIDLFEAGISDLLYQTNEGTHSCYVDSVAGTLHASSYDGSKGLSFDDDWVEKFRSFPVLSGDTITI